MPILISRFGRSHACRRLGDLARLTIAYGDHQRVDFPDATNNAPRMILSRVCRAAPATLATGLLLGLGVGQSSAVGAGVGGPCKSFSYVHHHAHMTYRFSQLRISGARCSVIRKVVCGYFLDRGHPHGTVPPDGYDVYGWNIVISASAVDGRRKGAHFSGVYTVG